MFGCRLRHSSPDFKCTAYDFACGKHVVLPFLSLHPTYVTFCNMTMCAHGAPHQAAKQLSWWIVQHMLRSFFSWIKRLMIAMTWSVASAPCSVHVMQHSGSFPNPPCESCLNLLYPWNLPCNLKEKNKHRPSEQSQFSYMCFICGFHHHPPCTIPFLSINIY